MPRPTADDLDRVVHDLGERIRTLRLKNGLTIQELAKRAELSVSMVSTVERGKTSASLGTLHAIASGLGVGITSLFTLSGPEDSPIIPRDSQIQDTTAGGVRRRLAVYRADFDIEVYVDNYAPGTSHARTPSQHPGQEFGVVIEGELELQLGDELYAASEGDAAQFAAERAHLIRNASAEPARAVWINLRRL